MLNIQLLLLSVIIVLLMVTTICRMFLSGLQIVLLLSRLFPSPILSELVLYDRYEAFYGKCLKIKNKLKQLVLQIFRSVSMHMPMNIRDF